MKWSCHISDVFHIWTEREYIQNMAKPFYLKKYKFMPSISMFQVILSADK